MNSANQKLALTGARIIDGNGAAPILDGVLLMEGARITAIGERAAVPIPEDAQRLDCTGRTIDRKSTRLNSSH